MNNAHEANREMGVARDSLTKSEQGAAAGSGRDFPPLASGGAAQRRRFLNLLGAASRESQLRKAL
jgi:hypothetical protein